MLPQICYISNLGKVIFFCGGTLLPDFPKEVIPSCFLLHSSLQQYARRIRTRSSALLPTIQNVAKEELVLKVWYTKDYYFNMNRNVRWVWHRNGMEYSLFSHPKTKYEVPKGRGFHILVPTLVDICNKHGVLGSYVLTSISPIPHFGKLITV